MEKKRSDDEVAKDEADDDDEPVMFTTNEAGIFERLFPKREPHDGLAGPKMVNPAAELAQVKDTFGQTREDKEALRRQYTLPILDKLLPQREPHDGLAGPKIVNPAAENEQIRETFGVTEEERRALRRQYSGGSFIDTLLDPLFPRREPHDGLAGPKLESDGDDA